MFSGTIPISTLGGGGAPGGADFWGVVATGSDLIGRLVINEGDNNSQFPDCNIGFDSFRFTPMIEQFSADFDHDGDVDSDDLDEWQAAYGANASADADSDGDSDGRDFIEWQRQFGSGLSPLVVESPWRPSSQTIPEPSGWLLALILLTTIVIGNRHG